MKLIQFLCMLPGSMKDMDIILVIYVKVSPLFHDIRSATCLVNSIFLRKQKRAGK